MPTKNTKVTKEAELSPSLRSAEAQDLDAPRRGPLTSGPSGRAADAFVKGVPLPDKVDREELHGVLVAREAMCSTGLGEGIAIPHPRGPLNR